MTENQRKCAIICPVGQTGNIVPMTINTWLDKQFKGQSLPVAGERLPVPGYTEVIVLVPYTRGGLREGGGRDLMDTLLAECFPKPGHLARDRWTLSVDTYHWCPQLMPGKRLPQWPDCYLTNLSLHMLPIYPPQGDGLDPSGPLEDIDDDTPNEQFQDLIFGLATLLRHQGYALHLSLAGGRKTMSAYELLAAALRGAPQQVSHVLEPSLSRAKQFCRAPEHAALLNPRLSAAEQAECVRDQAKKMYQPPLDLYASIPVSFIDLSPLIPHMMQQVVPPDKLTALEQAVQTLEAQDIGKIGTQLGQYAILYQIGRLFRTELQAITAEAGRKLEQGILAGLWDSLLAHEFKGLSENFPNTLDKVRRRLPTLQGQVAQQLDELMQELTDTTCLLKDTDHYFRAIRMATGKVEDVRKALQDKTALHQEEVTCCTIADIIAKSKRLGDVTRGEKGAFDEILDERSVTLDDSQVQSNTKRVECFPWLLALAVFNLFKNVPEGQGCTVTVTVHDTTDGIEVVVEDNGRGFPTPPGAPPDWTPNDLKRLGTSVPPQGDTKAHQGLGLFVVNRIIEAHKGCLMLENKPQGGALHRITLPVAPEGESV